MSRWVRVTRRCFGCGATAKWSGHPSQVEVESARWAASHATCVTWGEASVRSSPQRPIGAPDPHVLPIPQGGVLSGPAPLPETREATAPRLPSPARWPEPPRQGGPDAP